MSENTNVDPIDLNLYFERFINPKRSSPPDFDIDTPGKSGMRSLIIFSRDMAIVILRFWAL